MKDVQPGHRRIVWDVLSEWEKLSGDNIVFNVVLDSGHSRFAQLSLHKGLIDIAGFAVEVDTDAYDLLVLNLERQGVILL